MVYPWLSLVWLPLVEYPADYRRLGSRSNSGLDQRAHARGLFPRLPRALLSDARYSCAKAAIALATEAKGPTLHIDAGIKLQRRLFPSVASSRRSSYAAGALARTRFGKMRVHDAPAADFLAEHHGRAGDELIAAVVDVLGRRRGAGPIAFGAAMAPDHRHVVGHDAAEVERRPVARLHVLPVEFPQPEPMFTSVVGVPVEVEEHRLGRRAPDRLELLPIEAGIGVDVVGVQLQDLLAVALGTADEVGFRHCLSHCNSQFAIASHSRLGGGRARRSAGARLAHGGPRRHHFFFRRVAHPRKPSAVM